MIASEKIIGSGVYLALWLVYIFSKNYEALRGFSVGFFKPVLFFYAKDVAFGEWFIYLTEHKKRK